MKQELELEKDIVNTRKDAITLGDRDLTPADLSNLLFDGYSVAFSKEASEKVEKCFKFLKSFSGGKLIYGINTGLGPMAQYKVDDTDLLRLQYNLIRSHCSGTGEMLDPLEI